VDVIENIGRDPHRFVGFIAIPFILKTAIALPSGELPHP